jgi:Tfp pilus assembly protein PilF
MARRDFRKAIAKDPRNYLAWYGLAGVTSGAAHQEAVAKVVELNPLSDEAKELSKGP